MDRMIKTKTAKDGRTAIRLPQGLKEQLMQLAIEDGRSYNDMMVMAMEYGVERIKLMIAAKKEAAEKWKGKKI